MFIVSMKFPQHPHKQAMGYFVALKSGQTTHEAFALVGR